jgi:hypothetical protein
MVALNKLHVTLIANNKEFWMKKKSTKYIFILWLIIYVLLFATKMRFFLWKSKKKYVLSRVPTFNDKKYFNYNFEKIRNI